MKAQKLKVVAPVVGDEAALVWKALGEKVETMTLGELKAALKYIELVLVANGKQMSALALKNARLAQNLFNTKIANLDGPKPV